MMKTDPRDDYKYCNAYKFNELCIDYEEEDMCAWCPKYTEESEETIDDVRNHNVGTSDYSKHKIQPWDIWEEYNLNPWDADIIKRILRNKEGDSRELDYEKIIHVCQERIRQIKEKD